MYLDASTSTIEDDQSKGSQLAACRVVATLSWTAACAVSADSRAVGVVARSMILADSRVCFYRVSRTAA